VADVDVDWAGDHVTLGFGDSVTTVATAVTPEVADRMIRQLTWATGEVRRFAEHRDSGKPDYAFQPKANRSHVSTIATVSRRAVPDLWVGGVEDRCGS
jgi:hypothetical protein